MIPVARTRKNKHATKEPFLDPVTKVIAPAGVKFDYPLEPLKTGKSCTVRGLRLAGSNVSDFFFGADMHPLRREHTVGQEEIQRAAVTKKVESDTVATAKRTVTSHRSYIGTAELVA